MNETQANFLTGYFSFLCISLINFIQITHFADILTGACQLMVAAATVYRLVKDIKIKDSEEDNKAKP